MNKLMYFIIGTLIIGLILSAFKSQKVDYNKDTSEGIQFYKGSWQEALKNAEKENKIIFLDIYATWCGPCKKLKAHTFSDANVGNFYNTNFINVTLDGEKGEGVELAEKYGIKAYPTLLFINSSGKIIFRTAGYHKVEEFNELGTFVLNKYHK